MSATSMPDSPSAAAPVRVFVYGKTSPELDEAFATAEIPIVADVEAANYMVWNSFKNTELTQVLHPGIRWVQLPSAGINQRLGAGVPGPERPWLSPAGAYCGPVAAHAADRYPPPIHRPPDIDDRTTRKRRE